MATRLIRAYGLVFHLVYGFALEGHQSHHSQAKLNSIEGFRICVQRATEVREIGEAEATNG